MSNHQPRVITRSDPRYLDLEWADGHETRYLAWELRALCPCAHCVDELTGVRKLDSATVPRDLVTEEVQLVGTYALTARFSDGHHTGIYPFPMLRRNDPRARAQDTSGGSSGDDSGGSSEG